MAARVEGKVKWFCARKGYGFIQRFDGQPDVLVRRDAIRRADEDSTLSPGDNVDFYVAQGKHGSQARDVAPLIPKGIIDVSASFQMKEATAG